MAESAENTTNPAATSSHLATISPKPSLHAVAPSERLLSIDALRGFDLFWIIGGGPMVASFLKLFANPLPTWLDRQFEHVPWIGFVGWDLIMPLFLFIVGVAMPFSLGKRLERGDTRLAIYTKVLYRVVVLWIFGMIAQGHLLLFRLDNLQLYSNTLQAIAAGYLISAIAMVEFSLLSRTRNSPSPPLGERWHQGEVEAIPASSIRDPKSTIRNRLALLAAALLILYWALLKFIPVPGCNSPALDPKCNLALHLDTFILGRFRDGSTYTWLLSSLGFGATTLIGVLAGQLLRGPKSPNQKTLRLAVAGIVCLAAGWLWSLDQPIIKHIWTSSMVLWAGGWSLLALALFYYVIDVRGCRRWAFPFIVIGANSILAYMIPEILDFIATTKSNPADLDNLAQHLSPIKEFILAAGAFGILWLLLYFLYRKKTFLRI